MNHDITNSVTAVSIAFNRMAADTRIFYMNLLQVNLVLKEHQLALIRIRVDNRFIKNKPPQCMICEKK